LSLLHTKAKGQQGCCRAIKDPRLPWVQLYKHGSP